MNSAGAMASKEFNFWMNSAGAMASKDDDELSDFEGAKGDPYKDDDELSDFEGEEETYMYSVKEDKYKDDDDLSDFEGGNILPHFKTTKSMSRAQGSSDEPYERFMMNQKMEHVLRYEEAINRGAQQCSEVSQERYMVNTKMEDFRCYPELLKIRAQERSYKPKESSLVNMLDKLCLYGKSMKRGYMLIIINYEFPDESKNLPKGSDIQELKEIFSKYGYEIRSFTNLSPGSILKAVQWYASKDDSNSFVCFISSHGNSTSLLGADGEVVRIKDIFLAANTKELKRKPKTFFIDACRSSPKKKKEIHASHLPDLPAECYFVGFSCLASKTSKTGNNSCGAYFEALITVFKDSFRFPPTDSNTRRNIYHLVQKANIKVRRDKGQQPEIRSSMAGEYFLQGEK